MCQGLASPAAAFNVAFVLQRRLSVLVWLLDSAAAAAAAAAAAPAVTKVLRHQVSRILPMRTAPRVHETSNFGLLPWYDHTACSHALA